MAHRQAVLASAQCHLRIVPERGCSSSCMARISLALLSQVLVLLASCCN